MDLAGRTVALYGRFTPGLRDRLKADIEAGGGQVLRDLTGRSDVFVVGALAAPLLDSGALGQRLKTARAHQIPVRGERRFAQGLAGEDDSPATLAIAQVGLTIENADVLAAFDLIAVDGELCRFGDAAVIRTAAELIRKGRSICEAVQVLRQVRARSPRGRHKVVLTPGGAAALQWDDGLTDLDGQTLLPLGDDSHASVDDLFDAAALAEAEGDAETAARLYDLCARADRADPIALYNLGNIRLNAEAYAEAALAYRRALARDGRFVEARYNLAVALEGAGDLLAAEAELEQVVEADPGQADAIFNLAQLRTKAGRFAEAKALYERFLGLGPSPEWAARARRAAQYCAARSAG